MPDRLAHRDLRNRSAEILRDVDAGASYEITNHGEVVALLIPRLPTAVSACAEPRLISRSPRSVGLHTARPPSRPSMLFAETRDPLRGHLRHGEPRIRLERIGRDRATTWSIPLPEPVCTFRCARLWGEGRDMRRLDPTKGGGSSGRK